MKSNLVVHLLSGGLDSVVMLYDLVEQGKSAHCLLFNYQQRHVKELEYALTHCARLKVAKTVHCLPQLLGSELTDGSGSVIVPARNPIMLSLAANLAVSIGSKLVTIAANKDDEEAFPDCREAFIESFNLMLAKSNIDVQVAAPYIEKSKAWIAERAQELDVNLSETWSCYRGGDVPCGECAACLKRNAAIA